MRAFDGIQRGRNTKHTGDRSQTSTRETTPPRQNTSSRSVGFVVLLVLVLGTLFMLRPSLSDQSVESAGTISQGTDNGATPKQSPKIPAQLTLPQGGGAGDSLDDLVILDQPTDTSAPQSEVNEESDESEADESSEAEVQIAASIDFTVRVLNGGGTAGAAASLRDELVADGYDVLSIGNAVNSYAQTILYYQADQRLNAEQVAQFLGEPAVAFQQADIAAPADVLIVLGSDR